MGARLIRCGLGIKTRNFSSQGWFRWIIGAALAAFALKLYLALTTYGTNDVIAWESFNVGRQIFGGMGLYHQMDQFNHPPLIIHFLTFLDFIHRSSGASFPFLLRLASILADLGSVVLVWNLLATDNGAECDSRAILAMALCPVSIMVSGFHGNTDPLMMFFVLASIYLIEKHGSLLVAGIAFGIACNIKVLPVIFIPAFFFYLTSIRRKAQYFFGAVIAFGVCSMPYLFQNPIFIIHRVFGYDSIYGQWGLSRVITSLGHDFSSSSNFDYTTLAKVLIFVSIFSASYWINRMPPHPSLFLQLGLMISFFMVLTPGFGIQYLAWLVPWVVAVGLRATIAYYLTAGIFQFLVYSFWSRGFPWYYADSITIGTWRGPLVFFELLSWCVVVIITVHIGHSLTRHAKFTF